VKLAQVVFHLPHPIVAIKQQLLSSNGSRVAPCTHILYELAELVSSFSEIAASEPSVAVKKPSGGWKVDMSYIDHRTTDPNLREARRRGFDFRADAASEVDMGDLDHCTTDLDRREALRIDFGDDTAAVIGGAKDSNGKFDVDASPINHRASQVDSLADTHSSGTSPSVAQYGTEKKEGSGWKVNTGYIQLRCTTAIVGNRDESKMESSYADPANRKYSYEELRLSKRPADVDPARKELYLSDSEFQNIFNCSPVDFSRLPKWKQQNTKNEKGLF